MNRVTSAESTKKYYEQMYKGRDEAAASPARGAGVPCGSGTANHRSGSDSDVRRGTCVRASQLAHGVLVSPVAIHCFAHESWDMP